MDNIMSMQKVYCPHCGHPTETLAVNDKQKKRRTHLA